MVEKDRLTVLSARLAWCARTKASFPRYYEPLHSILLCHLKRLCPQGSLTHSFAKPCSFLIVKQTRV